MLPAIPLVPSGAGYRHLLGQGDRRRGSGFRVLVENVPGAARVLVVAIPLSETRADAHPALVIEVVVSLVVLACSRWPPGGS